MKQITGDYWDHAKHFEGLCCTCNSTVKRDGSLVMGRGIAAEFAGSWPSLAVDWGSRVRPHPSTTGVLLTARVRPPAAELCYLIYFQTKWNWREPSSYPLIRESMVRLGDAITLLNMKSVLLPRPGCANGGLDWDEVSQQLDADFLFDSPPFNRITFIGKG